MFGRRCINTGKRLAAKSWQRWQILHGQFLKIKRFLRKVNIVWIMWKIASSEFLGNFCNV